MTTGVNPSISSITLRSDQTLSWGHGVKHLPARHIIIQVCEVLPVVTPSSARILMCLLIQNHDTLTRLTKGNGSPVQLIDHLSV